MPRTILDTTAPGPQQDWEVMGSVPGWEAVRRGSGDGLRIRSNTLFNKGYFHCGVGWMPYYGQISAVTIYYRARVSEPATTGTMYATIIRNGIEEHQNGPIVLTSTNWVDGFVRSRGDWILGTRFNPFGVGSLGAGALLVAPPANGYIEISEFWLEVEYIDSTTVYDPMITLTLPEALTGEMQWVTSGTQMALIAPSEHLSIFDNDPLDYRAYERTDRVYPPQYVTTLESRFDVHFVPFVVTSGFFYYVAAYDDGHHSVHLALFNVGAQYFIGLIGAGLDPNDPGAYFASYELDPFVGEDLYVRMTVDRDIEPETIGKVKVYLGYSDTPVLEVLYADFPTTSANRILFGTGDPLTAVRAPRCGVLVDFFSWHSDKKRNNTFESWRDLEFGPNLISAVTTDPSIRSLIEIPSLPGVVAGQSNHACLLDVVDASEDCFMRQYWMMLEETPVTYDLNVDYRMDTLATEGVVTLQRRSDHYYWDDAGSTWTPGYQSVTLPNQMNRAPVIDVMTGITSTNVPPYDEVFILQIGRKSVAPAAYHMYIYHADLERS